MNRFRSKKGFTLPETIILIAIVVILAIVLFFNIGTYLRDAKEHADQEALATETSEATTESTLYTSVIDETSVETQIETNS